MDLVKMRQSWRSFDQWNTQVHDDKQHACTESLKFAIQSAKVECTWIPVSVEQHKIHAVTRNLRYDSLLRSRYLGRHATRLPHWWTFSLNLYTKETLLWAKWRGRCRVVSARVKCTNQGILRRKFLVIFESCLYRSDRCSLRDRKRNLEKSLLLLTGLPHVRK